MSKFEKYEKNHPDILKNPKLAESIDKAKRKHRRRRSMIFQSILMAIGVMFLILGVVLSVVLDYHKAVPYICITCGIIAQVLFYILLKVTHKELRDNSKKLFWYNSKTGTHKFMSGAILGSSHSWQSMVYSAFSWLNLIICLIRFDNTRFESIPEAIFALVLLLDLLIFTGLDILLAQKVDEKYLINLRGELK